jgi:hypothetical protein
MSSPAIAQKCFRKYKDVIALKWKDSSAGRGEELFDNCTGSVAGFDSHSQSPRVGAPTDNCCVAAIFSVGMQCPGSRQIRATMAEGSRIKPVRPTCHSRGGGPLLLSTTGGAVACGPPVRGGSLPSLWNLPELHPSHSNGTIRTERWAISSAPRAVLCRRS